MVQIVVLITLMGFPPPSLSSFACVLCSRANSEITESLGRKAFPATPQLKCSATAGQTVPLDHLSSLPLTPASLPPLEFLSCPASPDRFPTTTSSLCSVGPRLWQKCSLVLVIIITREVTFIDCLLWAGPPAKSFLCVPHLICTPKMTQLSLSHFT